MKYNIGESIARWGVYQEQIESWTEKCEKNLFIKRIWQKDPILWTKNSAAHKEIKERLGWLTAPRAMKSQLPALKAFKEEIRQAGYTHAILLGMGGSSLAPEVLQNVFKNAPGYPKLLILDSTDPERIRDIENQADLSKTLMIVSSKSGQTIELVSLFKYFFEKIKSISQNPGESFIAITDPGTALEKTAKEHSFKRIFLAPPDIGGRFSALTLFGLVPACAIGADAAGLLESADKMMDACAADVPAASHPAFILGLGVALLAESGRDKLTLLTPPDFQSFGDWVEQLVAESTGKEGVGVLPVVREALLKPEQYSSDRFFVAILPEWEPCDELNAGVEQLQKAGHPVLTLRLRKKIDLGGEFFRWEMAVAAACALMKINAFDQPDVQAAKECTKKFLEQAQSSSGISLRRTNISMEEFWENAEPGDYAAILAFLPDRENFRVRLLALRDAVREKTRLAVTLGFGPRYLHSTGQLHKGGANNGVFILITAPSGNDLPIPGEKYTFAQLELAQAMGDFEALESKARWLIHIRLDELSDAALDKSCAELENAILAPVQ